MREMLPKDFKKLLTSRFLFTFAVQMQAVMLGWQIYEIMKDPLYLGLIGLTEAVPALGFALFAGYLVDRMAPIKAFAGVLSISLCSALVVLYQGLTKDSHPPEWNAAFLYVGAFLTGLGRSFSQPAIFAITPRLVERTQLIRALAISSSSMQTARIAGPAVGGLCFGFLGSAATSTLICAALILGLAALFSIRTRLPALVHSQKHESRRAEMLSGLKFVFRHPILFPALSLDMLSVLFGGVTALLPIFASDILFVGPKGLGALRAAPAVGAVLMGLILARTKKFRTGRSLLMAVFGFGLCILVFGLSQNFALSMAALLLSGSFDSISMVIRSTAVQLSSPDHMRGKISAVNSIFIGSSNELGEVESGLAAKFMGLTPSVLFGGTLCLMTVLVVAAISPNLRKLDLQKLAES